VCVFFVYMLAVCMFYGWPALLTFGFSGSVLFVLYCRDYFLFESNKFLLLLLLLLLLLVNNVHLLYRLR